MLIPTVRRIHNTNSDKVIGYRYSHKMKGQVQWESPLERDLLRWLEYLRPVTAFSTQPESFSYEDEQGGSRHYTPDARVIVSSLAHPLYIEVKPYTYTDTPVFRELHRARTTSLRGRRYQLLLATEREICQEPHLTSLKYLEAYASVSAMSPVQRKQALAMLKVPSEISISEFAERCAPHGIRIDQILHEIYAGALWVDIGQKVSLKSAVRVRRDDDAF